MTVRGGGIDYGGLPPGRGADGFVVALIGLPIALVVGLWWDRHRHWSRAEIALLAALGGLTAWSAVSITWASAPDLAWFATNRLALGTGVAVVAIAISQRVTDAPAGLAMLTAAATVPVLAMALGSRVLPDLLSPLVDTPRLAVPLGHANTLALIAVLAVPGALCLVTRERWRLAGVALLTVALLVTLLTGSRGGVLTATLTIALALWWFPNRPAMCSATMASLVGVVLPAFVGLSAGAFTADTLGPPASRRGIGLIFGVVVALGIAIAVLTADRLAPTGRRVADALTGPRGTRRVVTGVSAAVAAAAIAVIVTSRNAGSGAGRFFSSDSNNRLGWWAEAWRGFVDAPLAGHGAGSFPLTHLLERDDTLIVRQPHQLTLELLTELGVVGAAFAAAALGVVAWCAARAGRRSAPAVCIVVAFLVYAQLDVPGSSASVVMATMAAAGVIVGTWRPETRNGSARVGALRAAVAVCLASAVAIGGMLTWSAARRANAAAIAPPERTLQLAPAAIDRNPWAIGGLLALARAQSALGQTDAAVETARRATRRQPENPLAWECLVNVLPQTDPTASVAAAQLARLNPRRGAEQPALCRPRFL